MFDNILITPLSGMCELGGVMADGELAVFFRNNHFSTILKRKVHVYIIYIHLETSGAHERLVSLLMERDNFIA